MTSRTKSALEREAILALLTDAEVSKVGRAEGEPRLNAVAGS